VSGRATATVGVTGNRLFRFAARSGFVTLRSRSRRGALKPMVWSMVSESGGTNIVYPGE